jgi:3-deoxy-D-manno-octulosonate 8-phosphate phosphatase (KDO 8-P phosphatase)
MSNNKFETKFQALVIYAGGVLTSRQVFLLQVGQEVVQAQSFDLHDGLAINELAHAMGLKVFIVEGRPGVAEYRAKKLRAEFIAGGSDKFGAVSQKLNEYGWKWSDVALIGDDLRDLHSMEAAAFVACPADASKDVKAYVLNRGGFISSHNGGKGAIREFIDNIAETKQFEYIPGYLQDEGYLDTEMRTDTGDMSD